MEREPKSVAEWLKQVCEKERLSLREAAQRTGLSHSTIREVLNGARPSPETVRKLAQGFAGDGAYQRSVLEDKLLILAGYRTGQPQRELTGPLAELIDKVSEFSEPQVRLMARFAEFLADIEREQWKHQSR